MNATSKRCACARRPRRSISCRPRHSLPYHPQVESLEERLPPGDTLGLLLTMPHLGQASWGSASALGDAGTFALMEPSARMQHEVEPLTVTLPANASSEGAPIPPRVEQGQHVWDSADLADDPLAADFFVDPLNAANPFADKEKPQSSNSADPSKPGDDAAAVGGSNATNGPSPAGGSDAGGSSGGGSTSSRNNENFPVADGPGTVMASTGPVQLSLSTDGNQSVIQNNTVVTLTVGVPGTRKTEVDLNQVLANGGSSVVYFGLSGTDTSATVITPGGTNNFVSIPVRHGVTGSYQNDVTLTASVDGVVRGIKAATAISLTVAYNNGSSSCAYRLGEQVVTKTATTSPSIPNLKLNTATQLLAPFSLASNSTSLLAAPQFPLTGADGKSTVQVPRTCVEHYGMNNTTPDGSTGRGTVDDIYEPNPSRPESTPDSSPVQKEQDSITICPGPAPEDGGPDRSIDLSDGEKKLDITDLVVKGRGTDYIFRRIYQSVDCRGKLGYKHFGVGWRYSYADDYLLKDGEGPDETANFINYRLGPGYVFVNTGPGVWVPGVEHFVQLRKNPNTGDFEVREPDGMLRTYHGFGDTSTPNKNGRLKELRDRNDNRLTFHYERIDPDGAAGSGDEQFVLAYAIDTLGREIRYQYYAASNQTIGGRQVTTVSSNTAAWGRLAKVMDFKGNMDFAGLAESEDFAFQANNRTLTYDYDSEANLVRASLPAVGRDASNPSTPNANDFLNHKTTRYQYTTNVNRAGLPPKEWDALSEKHQGQLLHKLTHIWYPNEVKGNPTTNPPLTEAAEVISYISDSSSPFFGFVSTYTIGGTNANGVPSGGTIRYTYTDLNPDRTMQPGMSVDPIPFYHTPALEVQATDRNGNVARYIWGGGGTLLDYREFPRGLRSVEPAEYVQTHEYNKDRLLRKRTTPEGNTTEYTFNESTFDRFQQSNTIRIVQTPDPARGGDQPKIEQVFVYEPIYNRPCLVVSARGADMDNNGFTPPIADPVDRTMPDPYDPARRLNVRYARVEFFDYQESTEQAALAPDTRLDQDGSGGQVNQSPLIAVDPNVLTTEVWLVQELGLPETIVGLVELRIRLAVALTRLGLGDLNGDGDTAPTIAGNPVRSVVGSPVLLVGSNQRHLEEQIDPIDLVRQDLTYGAGGTSEGDQGGRLQTIVTMHQYNGFGQMTKTISPEGNVSIYDYFPENDPDGDGHLTPTPPPTDGRTLDNSTGGYLKKTVTDTTRVYVNQKGAPAPGTFSNNATNPAVTDITTRFTYDDVGNVITMINGRGIQTNYFVNEHDEVVQTTRAADISQVASADPSDPLLGHPDPNVRLTAFAYRSRTFYDFNGNLVLSQIEDRGNTSLVDGNGLGTIPMQAVMTTPGLHATNGGDASGGVAFVDSLNLYDRLDNLLETRVEVSAVRSLNTRYRYDGNENRVLTIYPEGNADSAVYDERELLFESTRGIVEPPVAGHYAPGDPTTFNRPGVDPKNPTPPSKTTYSYDQNKNLIESVDAQDHGGAKSAIHPLGTGAGDVTRMTYDGFDRRKTTTDPLGNQTINVYDPDSNVVRVIQNGDPINDVAGGKENRTLAVTEYIHDELSRVVATQRVLFLTPDVTPARTPVLTDTPAMDALAAYLADADSDTTAVPGAIGVSVIGRVTTLSEYDRESRVTFTVQDDLDAYRTDYDGASRVIKTTDSARSNGFSGGSFNPIDISGNTVETAYDDNNNPIERKEIDVTLVSGIVDEVFRTSYLYDSLDRLQTMVDNLGQAEDYRYDSRGNLVAQADAVGPVAARTVNRRGLGSTAAVTINNFGNVTRTFYDGINRTLQTEALLTPSGQNLVGYIGATLEGVKVDSPAGYVDPTQSEDGLITVHYAYDDNSRLLALRDDDGNTTVYIYDNQNRRLVERKGLNKGFQSTTFTIAGGDSGAFREVRRPPTLLDPPVDTEPDGTDITYVYDRDSNAFFTLDEAGNTFVYTFDALNRRKQCDITPAPGFVGTTLQRFEYDGLSRLSFNFDNNEPATANDDVRVSYFYDSLSRKVEEQQQIGTLGAKAISNSFDVAASGAEDQPSSSTYPDGRRVDSFYDALDRLVRRRDFGQTTDIGVYAYIGTLRVLSLTYQNSTRLVRRYDNLRRVVNQRWEKFTTGTPLGMGTFIVGFGHERADGSPAYDRANNKLIEEKLHDPDNSEVYTYDSAYRLKTFNRGTLNAARTAIATPTTTAGAQQSQTWNLDGVGNWTSNTHTTRTATGSATGTENRTSSDFNEIVTVTGTPYASGATGTHVLDKNGNLIDDGVRTYQWDALNRLRKVFRKLLDGDDTLIAEYTYDSGNRRFRKIVSNGGISGTAANGTTEFYYDGWRVVEERSPSADDRVERQYVYGNYLDEVLVLDDRYTETQQQVIPVSALNDQAGNQRHFYHANTLYHVYGLTDETGTLKEGYQYDAYGRVTVFTGPGPDGIWFSGNESQAAASAINNPYMYTGQRFDTETRLYYFKDRYYSLDLGRFVSRDSSGFNAGDLNLYRYAGNNPANRTDPRGLQDKDLVDLQKVLGDKAKDLDPAVVSFYKQPATFSGVASVEFFGEAALALPLVSYITGQGKITDVRGKMEERPVTQQITDIGGRSLWERKVTEQGKEQTLFAAFFEAKGGQIVETFNIKGTEVQLTFDLKVEKGKTSGKPGALTLTLSTIKVGTGKPQKASDIGIGIEFHTEREKERPDTELRTTGCVTVPGRGRNRGQRELLGFVQFMLWRKK